MICLFFSNSFPDVTQRAHHFESTSTRRGYYVDTSMTKFRRVPRHFRALFRCDFAGRKIHVVSTNFFRCNFTGRKIHVVSTNFFRCNFTGRKSTWFPHTFFDVISMVEKSTLFPRTFFDVISMVEKSTLFHVLLSV